MTKQIKPTLSNEEVMKLLNAPEGTHLTNISQLYKNSHVFGILHKTTIKIGQRWTISDNSVYINIPTCQLFSINTGNEIGSYTYFTERSAILDKCIRRHNDRLPNHLEN